MSFVVVVVVVVRSVSSNHSLPFRFTSSEDSDIPLSINCWPSDNGSGGCDVNIEYELENTDLELQV